MLPMQDQFAFSRFRLDSRRRTLTCDGKLVPLQDRGFDVLHFLIRERHRVVTKDDIKAEVWRGLIVDDRNVSVQMSNLRKALADHCAGEELIVTVARQGYRFVGDIAEPPAPAPLSPAAPASAPPARPPGAKLSIRLLAAACLTVVIAMVGLWAAGVFLAPARGDLSIVVLPFRNLSEDRSKDYLADAIQEDLIADLVHLPSTLVIAAESARAVGDDPISAAAALNVRYAIKGALRPEPGLLHINAALFDVQTRATLWSEHFDVAGQDLGQARDIIESRIAHALDLKLASVRAAQAERKRPSDRQAWDEFYRGRHAQTVATTLADRRAALSFYSAAIVRKPDFVEARAARAWLTSGILRNSYDQSAESDRMQLAEDISWLQTYAPENDVALAARARLETLNGDCTGAETLAKEALTIAPSSMQALDILADCSQLLGELDWAAKYLTLELTLDPESTANSERRIELGHIKLIQGFYAEAKSLLSTPERAAPKAKSSAESGGIKEFASLMLIAADELLARHTDATARLAAFEQTWPNRSVWRIEAIYARPLLAFAGVQRIFAALQASGMRMYSDEHAPGNAPSQDGCLNDNPYSPTPVRLDHGQVWYVADLRRALAGPSKPLLLDVGDGMAVPEGAEFISPSAPMSVEEAVRRLLGDKHVGKDQPIVVIGAGPFGCESYSVAQTLIRLGFTQVAWLRGGEESIARDGSLHFSIRRNV